MTAREENGTSLDSTHTVAGSGQMQQDQARTATLHCLWEDVYQLIFTIEQCCTNSHCIFESSRLSGILCVAIPNIIPHMKQVQQLLDRTLSKYSTLLVRDLRGHDAVTVTG